MYAVQKKVANRKQRVWVDDKAFPKSPKTAKQGDMQQQRTEGNTPHGKDVNLQQEHKNKNLPVQNWV